jgi:shikimate kinase
MSIQLKHPTYSRIKVSLLPQVKQTHSLVQATPPNKDSIAAAIKGIEICGCTNLSGGLVQGISVQLQSQPTDKGINSSSAAVTAAAAAPKEAAPTCETPTPAGDWDMVEWADDASASETTALSPKTVRSVFLFTDGLPTDGVKDAGTMEGLVKKLIAF